MCKNVAFDAKVVKKRLTKIFIAIFAPHERLPSSATLLSSSLHQAQGAHGGQGGGEKEEGSFSGALLNMAGCRCWT